MLWMATLWIGAMAGCAMDAGPADLVERDIAQDSTAPVPDWQTDCSEEDAPCDGNGDQGGGGGTGISPTPNCGALCYGASDCRDACGSVTSWVCIYDIPGASYGHCRT